MSMQLPLPVDAYFEADNAGGQSVADCFTADAVVQDEGHTYRGTEEIRAWRAEVAAKFTYTCEPFSVESRDGETIVNCHLVGNFPGSPVDLRFFFRLAGDKIATLKVIP